MIDRHKPHTEPSKRRQGTGDQYDRPSARNTINKARQSHDRRQEMANVENRQSGDELVHGVNERKTIKLFLSGLRQRLSDVFRVFERWRGERNVETSAHSAQGRVNAKDIQSLKGGAKITRPEGNRQRRAGWSWTRTKRNRYRLRDGRNRPE
jgi:hypothetical protein